MVNIIWIRFNDHPAREYTQVSGNRKVPIYMKICFTCKINKNITSFNKDSHRPDGLTSSCKRCLHINNYKRKATKLSLKEQYILFEKLYIEGYTITELMGIFNCAEIEIQNTIKYFGLDNILGKLKCSKCKTWKILDDFANDTSRKSTGKRNWCKLCFNTHRAQLHIKKQIKETSQKYFIDNQEKILKQNKTYYDEHVTEHSARVRFNKLKRQKATPLWADKEKIKDFYLEAARLTKETGVVHEVDHIIPYNTIKWDKRMWFAC